MSYRNHENIAPINGDELKSKYNRNKYIMIFLAILLLFFGFVIFFQICSVQAGWCTGIGFAGSEYNDVDPNCVAVTDFIGVCLIILGVGFLVYAGTMMEANSILSTNKNYIGMSTINGDTEKEQNSTFMSRQTKEFMRRYNDVTGKSVAELDSTLVEVDDE